MKYLRSNEEKLVIIAIVIVIIIFLYSLISQLSGINPVSIYDATATAGAEWLFKQLTAQP